MSVKLEDIARETGFSISTVSRVLSKSTYPVSEPIREKVLRAADMMGYRPNLAARSLRTDRTNTIGIIVDDLLSPFTPPIVRGIQDYLNEHGFLSLIVNSDRDPDQEQAAIKTLLSRPVDGIVFVEYSHQTHSDDLERSDKPHVFVHRLFGSPIKNSVVPDDYYGASLATEHLIQLGHRRIGYISGPAKLAHVPGASARLCRDPAWSRCVLYRGARSGTSCELTGCKNRSVWRILQSLAGQLVRRGSDAGSGYQTDRSHWSSDGLYRPLVLGIKNHTSDRKVKLTAIPYYAWGNRGLKSMRVWIPLAMVE